MLITVITSDIPGFVGAKSNPVTGVRHTGGRSRSRLCPAVCADFTQSIGSVFWGAGGGRTLGCALLHLHHCHSPFQSLGRDSGLGEAAAAAASLTGSHSRLSGSQCEPHRHPHTGLRDASYSLRPGWRKTPLNRTHPASGTGSWACFTGSSATRSTTGSGTRWAWRRAPWPSRGSRRHPAGRRWFLTWRTVSAAGRTEGRTARTSAPTSPPISTRSRGAGWAPGWPGREWSSAFGSRWCRTRSPTSRRLRGGREPSETRPRCRRPGETVSTEGH